MGKVNRMENHKKKIKEMKRIKEDISGGSVGLEMWVFRS